MLIDNYIPEPDAVERHSISIEAPADTVYRALRNLDLRNLTPVRLLFAIRGLPSFLSGRKTRQVNTGAMTLESLTKIGFVVLAEEPGKQIVLGVTGRFWHPGRQHRALPQRVFLRTDSTRYGSSSLGLLHRRTRHRIDPDYGDSNPLRRPIQQAEVPRLLALGSALQRADSHSDAWLREK